MVQVRLYRPFPARALVEALPSNVRSIAVLDRTKEPGSVGEPLFLDTVAAVTEAFADGELEVMPRIVGGRYGLSSKEFTPGMVAGVFDELEGRATATPLHDRHQRRRLGNEPRLRRDARHRAARHGPRDLLRPRLGRDRRGEQEHDQDPRLRGGTACAGLFRLRLEEVRLADGRRICASVLVRSGLPYLVQQAGFVGCHQFGLLDRVDVLGRAAHGATLLLNCAHPPEAVWDALSRPVQEQILTKHIDLHVVDAGRIAREAGLPGRINIVLQTCFFALSGVVPREQAIERIKASIAKTYGRRGAEVVERNEAAVDHALAGLHRVEVPQQVTAVRELPPVVPIHVPEFVRTVTAEMLAGRGDDLPVSALPVDGTYPSGTAAYEKRNISDLVAAWDADLCIQCGNCSFVCPHSVIRSKYYDRSLLGGAPDGFESAPLDAVGLPDARFTLQVYLEDCTGCALCVEACPVSAPADPGRKAINLARARAAARERAGEDCVLRDASGNRAVAGRLRHRPRYPVPGTAVRVLGRVRRLWRDALRQASLATLRRPADGRQRDRLLVDLRRQPADHAVDD